ncbi:MAG: SWIM zinc finger family protein [Candidatus Aenigmarchaeota archaeon]|nr:SWIM zinc finger family protein [Candidatus Aenigmarchaeota archaeon]
MNLHEITEKDIKNIADSTVILNRGKKYYFSGMVKSMTVNADLGKITAEVKGNYGTYTVDIEIDEDKKLDYYCDCPYEGYGCKHIVAVL